MQSMFRLPWSSEQLKLSEKPTFDKMRPSPVVEIPILNQLKRKLPDFTDALPPQPAQEVKKQRPEVEYPHQLPTPSSPFPRPRIDIPQHSLHANPPPPRVDGVQTQTGSAVQQATGGAAANGIELSAETSNFRKRADSVSEGYFASKQLHDQPRDMVEPNTTPDPLSGLTPLQQVIENQFNMQILLKHNELRLIEQELAKCQVALEQLRRCELRPFPGSSQPDVSLTEGTGPAIHPPPGFTRPSHAPPYGVTDGPYTRHYQQWLIRDPQFDSVPAHLVGQADNLANRSTRNNGYARKTGSKSLGTSTRASESLQAIPNYPQAAPKDKGAVPLVLKRSTDSQLVKLVCKDCHRWNFSSIQGFLNHCRIAHKVDYKSHDAAAIDCGQLLEPHELANVPAGTQAASAPKPAPSRSQSISVAPMRLPNATSSNLVHPLNTPAATPVNTPGPRPTPQAVATTNAVPNIKIPSPQSHRKTNEPFKASAHVPRLSAHFAKHNLGGDLEQAFANAKKKIDLSAEDDMMSPDTPDTGSPVVHYQGGKHILPGAGGMRPGVPDANATGFPRPQGHRLPNNQRPRPLPLAPAPPRGHDVNMTQSNLSSPHEINSATLSPNAVDSNPGMVSDHEDDDHASDEDSSQIEMAPPSHPLQPVGRSCEDHMEIDVDEDAEMDQHGVIIRRNSMLADEARGIRGAGSPSRKMGGK